MKRVQLVIAGDVQGVGYRSWARSKAQKLGLTGCARNREDRTVAITAEGTKQALLDFITLCRRGPDVSLVSDVSWSWSVATGEFESFDVLY